MSQAIIHEELAKVIGTGLAEIIGTGFICGSMIWGSLSAFIGVHLRLGSGVDVHSNLDRRPSASPSTSSGQASAASAVPT
ncbi:MAG: hypothetical protein ACREYF_06945 [Gammaproteobacteria bacterium]